jgi:hypothetical protein
MLWKNYTTVNTLHSNGILLVFIEFLKDIKKLLFRNFRYELDHFIEYYRCYLPHLWNILLRHLNEHAMIDG